MPAGLDGNRSPIVTPARRAVVATVVQAIAAVDEPRVLVGIDGAPGTGKSTFADEIAPGLVQLGWEVVRATTDSFHRPRVQRYRLGPTSPEGYYRDSHDFRAITDSLLRPFAGGAHRVQVTAFDEPTDARCALFAEVDTARAVLVFDGLFLLRAELADHWHLTVFLQAETRREEAWHAYISDGLPESEPARQHEIDRRLIRARWPRYRDGWELYRHQIDPAGVASIVIDNNDFAVPVITT